MSLSVGAQGCESWADEAEIIVGEKYRMAKESERNQGFEWMKKAP